MFISSNNKYAIVGSDLYFSVSIVLSVICSCLIIFVCFKRFKRGSYNLQKVEKAGATDAANILKVPPQERLL